MRTFQTCFIPAAISLVFHRMMIKFGMCVLCPMAFSFPSEALACTTKAGRRTLFELQHNLYQDELARTVTNIQTARTSRHPLVSTNRINTVLTNWFCIQ